MRSNRLFQVIRDPDPKIEQRTEGDGALPRGSIIRKYNGGRRNRLPCLYDTHYKPGVWHNYVQTLTKMKLSLPECKKKMQNRIRL